MHSVLRSTIDTILAQAIALEAQEEHISQVLAILTLGGASDVRLCGGGTTPPFIVADIADDAVTLGEIDAALAMVGVSFRTDHAQAGIVSRHYSAIPATISPDSIGVTLLLRILSAASKVA